MGSTKLLDHGYLTVVEHWGSDERIVEAARMSTGKGFLGWGPITCECIEQIVCETCDGSGEVHSHNPICWTCHGHGKVCPKCKNRRHVPGDEKLLKFLYDNKHATPFEFAGVVIEVQAPIFVFREWHRHRTQSYNEMSARYTPLPDVNYVPSVERLLQQSGGNKQAASTGAKLTAEDADVYRAMLTVMYNEQEELYQVALRRGVPKELARLHLPVGRYSRMRASANLRNWLGFLTLRQAPNAQWEIRQYADALNSELVSIFPRTMELFNASS